MSPGVWMLAVTDSWVSVWLTPIWLLCGGVLLGLLVLAALVGLLFGLSRVPALESLRRSGWPAHALAGFLALLMAAAGTWLVRGYYVGEGVVEQRGDELALVGFGIFALASVLAWALVFCSSQRCLAELPTIFGEGAGLGLLVVGLTWAGVGLLTTLVADDRQETFASLGQFFSTGQQVYQVTVPGVDPETGEAPRVPLPVRYDPRLLEEIRIVSDRNLLVVDAAEVVDFRLPPYRLEAREPVDWNRRQSDSAPLPLWEGAKAHVQNLEFDPAELSISIRTLPPVRQVGSVFWAALGTVLWGLLLMVQQGVAPRVSAIALATAKGEMSQLLFLVLMLGGAVAIVLFTFMPFYTFGEDIKLLKDCGITLILVVALLQGIWSASSSVSEEIEGRTALTVLSKPVGRGAFVIGKILGIFWIVSVMFLVLGSVELLMVAFKPIYDAREGSEDLPSWAVGHLEVVRTVPGLAMALMQAVTLGSLSVALATRMSQLANFTICFSVYLVGHLVEVIVSSTIGGFPVIQFVAQLIAVLVPNLEQFSMQAAIDAGNPIPLAYLACLLLYALLYGGLTVLLALLLFEDRDLA